MKQNEVTMSENEMVEFVNMYNGIVPKNQVKKFNALDLKGKVQKLKFYQDIIKMKEDARIKNSIINRTKELFEKRHATIDDAKEVLTFCSEFIDNYKQREIDEIDNQIAALEEKKKMLA